MRETRRYSENLEEWLSWIPSPRSNGVTSRQTLQGYEAMNMLRKGQIRGIEKGDSMKQVAFIASLFGVAI